MSSDSRAKRWFAGLKVTTVLAGVGAGVGALGAMALNMIAAIFTGDPTALGVSVYTWHVGACSAAGAVLGPTIAWTMMRGVPIWRAVAEPATAAVVATAAGVYLIPAFYPFLVPAALIASAIRLRKVYGHAAERELGPGGTPGQPLVEESKKRLANVVAPASVSEREATVAKQS